ncbi:MAG: class I fructose-bisphosphate aldolase [Acidimicrobiales bacterium]
MDIQQLRQTAEKLVGQGRGILAVDESTPTCNKRFAVLGIDTTETNRQAYRQLLLTGEGLNEYVGGAILFDETIRQHLSDGRTFPEFMADQGLVPGIKVDTGAKTLAGQPGESVTEGLDGLRDRLTEYHTLGARFAKWRAVIAIGEGLPSSACLNANAHALARYAALCQEAGLVPIVEPEVLMEGEHGIDQCQEATSAALTAVFDQLDNQGVDLQGIVLKPNMVVSGMSSSENIDSRKVAERTMNCLLAHVPAAVPGIAFLSGGQSDEKATEHLNLLNQIEETPPWSLTFSYGRALQRRALETWAGDSQNTEAAIAQLLERARANSRAALGQHTPETDFTEG